LVAIHQPNFLPWLGFFDKIARADVFVLLDSVQNSKTGGTWTNRVRARIGGEAGWLTVPIVRGHGVRAVRNVEINEATAWRDKMLRTLALNYARAAKFSEVFPHVERWIRTSEHLLAAYNEVALRAVIGVLGLPQDHLVRSSSLNVTGRSTDLLISIVRAVGGDTYLAGGGAGGYQVDAKFAEAGLALAYQEFRHPVYPQSPFPGFLPGLSIVDALFHCGIGETRRSILLAAGSTGSVQVEREPNLDRQVRPGS